MGKRLIFWPILSFDVARLIKNYYCGGKKQDTDNISSTEIMHDKRPGLSAWFAPV
jgi:hypothetical protein